MPAIIDETCWNCEEPVEFELHPDGSVKVARCRCGGPHYGPGDAYARGVWQLLATMRARAAAVTKGWKGRRLEGHDDGKEADKAFGRGVDMAAHYIARDIGELTLP